MSSPKISINPVFNASIVKHKKWVKLLASEIHQGVEKITYPDWTLRAASIVESAQSNHFILRLMKSTFLKSTSSRKPDKYLRLRHKYLRRNRIVF